MRRIPLDMYDDDIPEEMRRYLRHYGWHFNKKACDYAVSLIRKKNANTGKMEKVDKLGKEQVDAMLTKYGVQIENTFDYDYVYLANKLKSVMFKSGISDEQHLAMAIKDVIEDSENGDGEIMRKWDAEMTSRGIPIEWDEIV